MLVIECSQVCPVRIGKWSARYLTDQAHIPLQQVVYPINWEHLRREHVSFPAVFLDKLSQMNFSLAS